MDIMKATILFSDGESYEFDAFNFSIDMNTENPILMTLDSVYNKESLSTLETLTQKKVTKVIMADEEGAELYIGEEWTKIERISIHYQRFYKSMVINFTIGVE